MSANAGQRRIPIGPALATAGAVLLVVSLFLDWYDQITGFTVFELVDLLLVMLALFTVVSLAGGMGLGRPLVAPPISLAVATMALVVVVTQVLNDPPAVAGEAGPDKEVGIWLALAGSALMAAGALLAGTRIALAVEARRRDETPPPVDHEATTAGAPAQSPPSGRPERP
jgi:hypothetical protein